MLLALSRSPLRYYRLICGLNGLFFGLAMTMFAVYQMDVVGSTDFQMVIAGTILELSIFAFEIPTGIIADLRSRKLSFSMGYLFSGLGFVVIALIPEFWAICVGSVIWGFGETLVSGAREAWIADELPVSDDAHVPATTAFVTGNQWTLIGRFVGTWMAVVFAVQHLSLPILVGALGMVAMAFVCFAAPERGFHRSDEEGHSFAQMARTFRVGWKFAFATTAIGAVIFTNFLIGFSSEGFDRLWQALFKKNFLMPDLLGTSLTWWALLNTAAMLLSVALLWALNAKGRLTSPARLRATVFVMTLVIFGGLIAFGAAPSFTWAIVAFMVVRTVRRAFDPLIVAWLNEYAPKATRATLLSFSGQLHSFGEILGGPLIGKSADLFSTRISMYVSAGLLLPGIPVLAKWISRSNRADERTTLNQVAAEVAQEEESTQ